MLEREFQYFKDHKTELVAQFANKFIVIKGEDVLGAYNSEIEAYREAQKITPIGTFLIQECTTNQERYTQTFHSRAIFA